MTKLTEEMVVARSKQSDLSSIKRLNCWGAELTDVSILKRMANVEVLAFSINKIKSLAEFQHCRRLKELYVRKNRIADISELRHLRRLPSLKILWLDENPCAEVSNYRMTVLRALPNLEKLDNVNVEVEEVEEAAKKGTHINDSDAEDDYEPELDNYNQYWSGNDDSNVDKNNVVRDEYKNGDHESDRNNESYDNINSSAGHYNRPAALHRSPPIGNSTRNIQDVDRQREDNSTSSNNHTYSRPSALPRSPVTTNGSNIRASPVRQRYYSPENYEEPRYERSGSRSQYFERSASLGDDLSAHQQPAQSQQNTSRSNDDPVQRGDNTTTPESVAYRRMIHHSQSANSIKEYSPVNGDQINQNRYQHQNNNNRHSVDMTSPQSQHGECYFERGGDRYASQSLTNTDNNQQFYQSNSNIKQQPASQQDQWERDSIVSFSKERDGQIASAVMADHKGFTRRPMTRNSNLLSAVLCLVKELDYTSLEVAEMAVRCRMDELANRP